MRERRKLSVTRVQEEDRHAVSKINSAVSMKIITKASKRCNILTMREVEDSQSEERR